LGVVEIRFEWRPPGGFIRGGAHAEARGSGKAVPGLTVVEDGGWPRGWRRRTRGYSGDSVFVGGNGSGFLRKATLIVPQGDTPGPTRSGSPDDEARYQLPNMSRCRGGGPGQSLLAGLFRNREGRTGAWWGCVLAPQPSQKPWTSARPRGTGKTRLVPSQPTRPPASGGLIRAHTHG